MTKFLTLLRHLKSDWGVSGLDDRERPLAPRGIKAAPFVRDALALRCPAPGMILCSPARRTRDTFALVCGAFPDATARFDDALYAADAASLLARIAAAPEDIGSLLLIGHNPGLHDAVRILAAEPGSAAEAARLAAVFLKFPTGAAAAFELDVAAWSEIGPGCGRLRDAFTPKSLRSGSA